MLHIYQARKRTADIIKYTRNEYMGKDYTQAKMAELLGLKSDRAYANIENGDAEPKWQHISKLCEIFGCDIGYLMGEHTTLRHVAADIQDVTGLSEAVSNKLTHQKTTIPPKIHIGTMNEMIVADAFGELVSSVLSAVRERYKLNLHRLGISEKTDTSSIEENVDYMRYKATLRLNELIDEIAESYPWKVPENNAREVSDNDGK